MLDGVLDTPLRFYETNPSGRILNKFSQDLGAMDVQLPRVMLDALQMLLVICGATAVVLIVNPIFFIPMLLLAVMFRAVRRVYMKASIHLRRLNGISKPGSGREGLRPLMDFSISARSPIFTEVSSTLSGLSVIRSTRAQPRMIRLFDALQDLHMATSYLFLSTTIAFCQVLDLLAVTLIALLLLYFLVFPTGKKSLATKR